MDIKIGKKGFFGDLEIGKIFAWFGSNIGWNIYLKTGDFKTFILASDNGHGNLYIGKYEDICFGDFFVYELPESIQKLWKEE